MNAALDFEILFWILFLLAPVISRLLKKRRSQGRGVEKKPQPLVRSQRRLPDASPTTQSERQLSPFEEALRQIQEALSEAGREQGGGPAKPSQQREAPQPARAERPTRPPAFEPSFEHPEPRPRRGQLIGPPRPASDRRTLFERQTGQPIPARPSKAAKPVVSDEFYDDAFEAEKEEPFHETVHTHVPETPDPTQRKPEKRQRTKWEEAMVMVTVLDKPRSLQPWQSRLQRSRRRYS